MAKTAESTRAAVSPDLAAIAGQTQEDALRQLKLPALNRLRRELREFKEAAGDGAARKALGQAIRRTGVEKRRRKEATAAVPAPAPVVEPPLPAPAPRPVKAEAKPGNAVGKEAEKAARKAARQAERQAARASRDSQGGAGDKPRGKNAQGKGGKGRRGQGDATREGAGSPM